MHNSDKSKVRCIKQKIYKQLKLSKEERSQNMTERWARRLNKIKLPPDKRVII